MMRLRTTVVGVVGLLAVAGAAAAAGPSPGTARGGDGIAVAGGARLVAASSGAGSTILQRFSREDGAKLGQRILHGTLGIPLVTYSGLSDAVWSNGRRALLATSIYDDVGHTTFVVLDTRTLRPLRTIRLQGAFGYDALSPDGRRLYLLQYPGGVSGRLHYVVRSLNMRTGRLEPGAIVDKTEPDERMNGIALNRARGPKRTWAYTLYNGGASHAFVHALNTRTRTARCIDLPREGEEQTVLEQAQMAVRGGFLTLREPGGGLLARIDTRTFAVET